MRTNPSLHAVALLALATGCGRHATLQVGPEDDLAAAFAGAPDRSTVRLGSGRYHLDGPGIRGKSLNITGAGMNNTVIETTSGDGLLFADSLYSALQDLTVTAVTVERGQLTLVGVRVDGGGVAVSGREGSRLIVRNSEISGNHTIGVRLGTGSAGTLEDALIDGGVSAGGVGMEIQQEARASVLNTVIRRHGRALLISDDADVEIHGNLFEDAQTAGFEGGGPRWRIDDNVLWLADITPDEATILRVCGNLPALRYGRGSAFYVAFCRSRPGPE